VLPTPRRARDDEDVARPVPPPVRSPRVYADGSALSRYLDGAPCRAQWLAWTAQHEDELITTPLGLTELRRIAQPRGVEATVVARDVEERVEVVRFSDQTLRAATKVSGVLPPFTALHLGVALAHPDVGGVATYDLELAQVCALHGLTVVSPGWPAHWWERSG
jgi:predicted nucleic acid-binding protein